MSRLILFICLALVIPSLYALITPRWSHRIVVRGAMSMMSDVDAPTEAGPSSTRLGRLRQAPRVLRDIISVILSTGPRPQITRTLQVTVALNKVLRDFARNPKSFQDDNGRIVPPRLIRHLFENLGTTYIKLGQFIASSPTLFPAEYVLEFQSCLDNAPKVPYTRIRKIIQDDLGRPIASAYAFVDPVPIASASVAQVPTPFSLSPPIRSLPHAFASRSPHRCTAPSCATAPRS